MERDDNVSGRFGSKPVRVGAEYELEVSEISKRGDGVARIKGFVIFIAGAQKGQKYKVKITKVADRFAVGKIAEEGQSSETSEPQVEKEASDDDEDDDEEES
ncbi:MAG: TRAM domain-containing protein [Thaumarchaeota archaeon]|nr:TRAM domain-containing protein [Nitrososphaerota archaeon]